MTPRPSGVGEGVRPVPEMVETYRGLRRAVGPRRYVVQPHVDCAGFYTESPGIAPLIAENGWTCNVVACRRSPRVEVGWAHPVRSPLGDDYQVIRQGACDEHAREFAEFFAARAHGEPSPVPRNEEG